MRYSPPSAAQLSLATRCWVVAAMMWLAWPSLTGAESPYANEPYNLAAPVLSANETSAESMDAASAPSAEGQATQTTFRFRGRFDVDSIWTTQSPASEATFGDLGDVVGIRRAWLGADGTLAIGGRYAVSIDLVAGDVIVRDMFFGLGDVREGGEFRAGHYLEPFSLELGTPSYALPFMECSASSVLDPARNWGLGHFQTALGDRAMLALGIFQAGTDPSDFEGGPGSTVGFTGKLTAAPLNEGDGERLIHLGLALSERLPESGVIIVGLLPQSPLIGVGDAASTPFLPSISIPASFQQLLNLQLAAARGSFWTIAEWNGTWIDQRSGGSVFLYGCHADCGCFLTGEHRPYQTASGTLGPVRVNRPVFRCHAGDRPTGWGAWELTARMAYLDFQDLDLPPGPQGQLRGIRLPEATFGLNWYLADRIRLMFNYSYAVPDEPNTGTSVASIFATRLSLYW